MACQTMVPSASVAVKWGPIEFFSLLSQLVENMAHQSSMSLAVGMAPGGLTLSSDSVRLTTMSARAPLNQKQCNGILFLSGALPTTRSQFSCSVPTVQKFL